MNISMSLLELGSRPYDWQDPASDLMRIFDHSELESVFRRQALDNLNILILLPFPQPQPSSCPSR